MESHPSPDNGKVLRAFSQLLGIMEELRKKCPWDQQQTMESLRHLTIEETFELSEAILEGDMENIKKELGDLLLHIVFYAVIAAEQQAFTITNVVQALCEKLVYRHPHIYGRETAQNTKTVKQNWEKRKLQEKGNQSVLSGLPRTLPSLIKAMRLQEKASSIGWGGLNSKTAWQQVQRKMQILTQQGSHNLSTPMQQKKAREEFGELLFLLVNYANLMEVNPEEALEKANKKFIQKFHDMEQLIANQGKQIAQLSTKELMNYWEETK